MEISCIKKEKEQQQLHYRSKAMKEEDANQ